MADETQAAAGATIQDSPAATAPDVLAATLLTGENPAAPPPEEGTPAQTETKDETPAAEAPEKYEFKLPEGVEMDDAALAEFEPLAREFKLDNARAQKLVDLYAKKQAEAAQKWQEARIKQAEDWVKTVRTDPEIGGHKFTESINLAQSAIARFAPPELKQVLDTTGLGSHPAMVKMCVAIGRAMAEDKFHGSGAQSGFATPEAKLYPTMNTQ